MHFRDLLEKGLQGFMINLPLLKSMAFLGTFWVFKVGPTCKDDLFLMFPVIKEFTKPLYVRTGKNNGIFLNEKIQ
jgi:hypothetical protein